MTEREKVLLRREGAVAAIEKWAPLRIGPSALLEFARAEAAKLFPLPPRTVPTVRRGVADGARWWYRVLVSDGNHTVYRYRSEGAARNGSPVASGWWPPEDQPTVAALLALPLTEEVEDTGEDGAK